MRNRVELFLPEAALDQDNSTMQAKVCYTKRAPEGEANGIDVGPGFALQSDAFRFQHGAVRSAAQNKDCRLHNELVPCPVQLINARDKLEKDSSSSVFARGFDLLQGLSTKAMPPAEKVKTGLDQNDTDEYFSFIENHIMEKTGASFAKVFCHTARNVSKNPSGAGNWAHTDVAPGSWATVLDTIQDDELPPGLPVAFAQRARAAQRCCVFTAWRYLGPDPTCTHSHLVVLDHTSLRPATDVVPFVLRDGDRVGHNYRLDVEAVSHHRWYYFPDMDANDEVLLFVAYDSNSTATSNSFAASSSDMFPSLFHSAVVGPRDVPQRQSIDVRVLVGWD